MARETRRFSSRVMRTSPDTAEGEAGLAEESATGVKLMMVLQSMVLSSGAERSRRSPSAVLLMGTPWYSKSIIRMRATRTGGGSSGDGEHPSEALR